MVSVHVSVRIDFSEVHASMHDVISIVADTVYATTAPVNVTAMTDFVETDVSWNSQRAAAHNVKITDLVRSSRAASSHVCVTTDGRARTATSIQDVLLPI